MSTEKDNWYVEVLRQADDVVEKTMGPMTYRKADKVADGVSINLNWDTYYVRTVQKTEPPSADNKEGT